MCGFIPVGFRHRLVIVLHGVEVVMLEMFAGFIAAGSTARTGETPPTSWATPASTDWRSAAAATSTCWSIGWTVRRMVRISGNTVVPTVWTAAHGVDSRATLPNTMIGLPTLLSSTVRLVCLFSLHFSSSGTIIILYLLALTTSLSTHFLASIEICVSDFLLNSF